MGRSTLLDVSTFRDDRFEEVDAMRTFWDTQGIVLVIGFAAVIWLLVVELDDVFIRMWHRRH